MTCYVLMLNDMREPNIENLTAVKWGPERDELRTWHDEQLCETYLDGERWRKSFRKGSQLEWFNPIWSAADWDDDNPYFGGVYVFPNQPGNADATGLRITK